MNITATATAPVTAETFVSSVEQGTVKFHTVRYNGTTRRVQILTGEALETAEWVEEQRDAGRTMKDIAEEMHVSVPTVRRMINALALTNEVELADQEEAQEWAELANENLEALEAEKQAAQEAKAAEQAKEEATTTA